MTLALQGLKKVMERIKEIECWPLKPSDGVDQARLDVLRLAKEQFQNDLRAIEAELNQTLYDSISHDNVNHRIEHPDWGLVSEICPRCRLKLLISAIESALGAGS